MRRLLEQVFGGMPREFASPQRKVAESMDELVAMIDQHNGLADCYVGAYSFATEERSYGEVTINKAVFDFDESWSELVDTHEWLLERNVAHFVTFSGSDESGHIYILTKPTAHQQSLEYFQRDIVVARAGLRHCKKCGNPAEKAPDSHAAAWRCTNCDDYLSRHQTDLVVDSNLIGDPSTMIRAPNTWHPGAERFCVPLKPDEVVRDTSEVYPLAESQRDLDLSDIICGERTPRIDQHAEAAEQKYRSYDQKRRLAGFKSDQEALGEFDAEVEPKTILDGIDCECFGRLLTDDDGYRRFPELGHKERRYLIAYLSERGYNPAEINKFLRFAIDEQKAKHSIVDEEQPTRIYRDGVKAPNKFTLREEGLLDPECPVHSRAGGGG